jgi:hypothetical protein
MQKHQFVLDFGNDTLSTQGHLIPTMTSGQEDLILAKKQAMHACKTTTHGGPPVHASH